MKKRFAILSTLLTITAMAQTKGTFKTHDFDNFRLHVYHTNDALGDASYIVEGTQAVVTLEQPLFRENVAEYDALPRRARQARRSAHRRLPCGRDRRPRDGHARRDARLHEGCGLRRHDAELRADLRRRDRRSADGSDGRSGLRHYAAVGGDSVPFRPRRRDRLSCREHPHRRQGLLHPLGSREGTREFPANLLAGSPSTPRSPRPVGRSHWAPSSSSADTAEPAGADAVRFKIDYLECVKRLLAANGTADEFARALRAAYPELPGEAGLDALAQALYADR